MEKPPSQPAPSKISESRKSSVVLKALMMAAGTFSSRILGLVREMALAAFFDRTITDAWAAAFRIPNLFRRLLGEGSLSVSLQPVLIQAELDDEKTGGVRARELMDSMHMFLVVLLSVLTVLGILFSAPLLKLALDDSYVQNVEAFALTVRLAQIMFGFLFFICLFAYYMAVLNSVGSFGWPAAAPVLFNISLIVSTVVPSHWLPVKGDTLAWGVLIGGFLQAAVLVYPLKQRHLFPGFKWNMQNADLRRVLRNMLPGFFGLGLMQVTLIINTNFASSLGEGAISYIWWADRLLELPLSLISVSLGTALLPTLAHHWILNEKEKTAEISERYLSLNFFVGAMAAAGLYVLALPIVKVLFQRGHFSEQDSLAVAAVLQVYALTLIPVSGIRVIAPAYYAVKNTWFPAVSSAVALVVHVMIAPRLMHSYGLQGLNFSSFVSAMINLSLLLGFYSYFIHSFFWKRFLLKGVQTAIAAAALIYASDYVMAHLRLDNHFRDWVISLIVSGVTGVVAFVLVSNLIRHPDMNALSARVKSLIKRKLK